MVFLPKEEVEVDVFVDAAAGASVSAVSSGIVADAAPDERRDCASERGEQRFSSAEAC